MPKTVSKKIFKPVKKVITNAKGKDEMFFMIKFRGLDKADIKQLRADLAEYLHDYLEADYEEPEDAPLL